MQGLTTCELIEILVPGEDEEVQRYFVKGGDSFQATAFVETGLIMRKR